MDIPLSATVQIRRQDSGIQEPGGLQYRTVVLDHPFGSVTLTANSSLSFTLEDETTLVTLNDLSAYDFSSSSTTAGDELEEMLRRVLASTESSVITGFQYLGEGVISLPDGAVYDLTDLLENFGGAAMSVPSGAIGMTVSIEAPDDADYARFTLDGDDPAHASFNGHVLYHKEIAHFGQTPVTPLGDPDTLSDMKVLRSASWSGDGVMMITFWGEAA